MAGAAYATPAGGGAAHACSGATVAVVGTQGGNGTPGRMATPTLVMSAGAGSDPWRCGATSGSGERPTVFMSNDAASGGGGGRSAGSGASER